jgi:hypothetical protein
VTSRDTSQSPFLIRKSLSRGVVTSGGDVGGSCGHVRGVEGCVRKLDGELSTPGNEIYSWPRSDASNTCRMRRQEMLAVIPSLCHLFVLILWHVITRRCQLTLYYRSSFDLATQAREEEEGGREGSSHHFPRPPPRRLKRGIWPGTTFGM